VLERLVKGLDEIGLAASLTPRRAAFGVFSPIANRSSPTAVLLLVREPQLSPKEELVEYGEEA